MLSSPKLVFCFFGSHLTPSNLRPVWSIRVDVCGGLHPLFAAFSASSVTKSDFEIFCGRLDSCCCNLHSTTSGLEENVSMWYQRLLWMKMGSLLVSSCAPLMTSSSSQSKVWSMSSAEKELSCSSTCSSVLGRFPNPSASCAPLSSTPGFLGSVSQLSLT